VNQDNYINENRKTSNCYKQLRYRGVEQNSELKLWNFGILEFWNFGILEFWNFGILEFWKSINKAVDTATAILVLFGIVFSSNVKSNVSATDEYDIFLSKIVR
jgi:hypothetical protein